MRTALAVLSLCTAAGAARADTAAVAEARRLLTTYDQDLSRLDRARSLLEAEARQDAPAETWIHLARACFLWGELRAKGVEEKLSAYDAGRSAARTATERAPANPDAHFWLAANGGRWARAAGGLRALSVLSEVRSEVDTVLKMEPQHALAQGLAGSMLADTPPFLGGDRAGAERHFRKGLEIDPRLTGLRVELARLLINTSRMDEAREQLGRVIDEKAPTYHAAWAAKDVPEARRLLTVVAERQRATSP
ncbi:MAG TPA: tetratricopeptide repeat protein [Vicinamibacteria bacterium]|nr:tetratricopeptide repeat protein [Vicinamibacteria bacterium]